MASSPLHRKRLPTNNVHNIAFKRSVATRSHCLSANSLHSTVRPSGVMSSPLASNHKLLELQTRQRRAASIRLYADLNVPRGWVREISRPGTKRFVRMVSLVIDPITQKPAIAVADFARLANGSYLYTINEEVHSEKVHWDHFLAALRRLTDQAVPVDYLEMERHAQALLNTPKSSTTPFPVLGRSGQTPPSFAVAT